MLRCTLCWQADGSCESCKEHQAKHGHKPIKIVKTGGIDYSEIEKVLLDLDFRKQTIFKFKDDIGTMITFPANWVNMELKEKMKWLLEKLQENYEEIEHMRKELIKLRKEKE